MWQCSCGKGCRTALECLSNVKPKKALALDKELESNIKSNVRQSRSESRGFDKKEYQKFYMRRKRLFEAAKRMAERLTAERLTAERLTAKQMGVV